MNLYLCLNLNQVLIFNTEKLFEQEDLNMKNDFMKLKIVDDRDIPKEYLEKSNN